MSWFCYAVLYVLVLLCSSLCPGFVMRFFMSLFCDVVLYVLVLLCGSLWLGFVI